MGADTPEAIKKQVRSYFVVFGALIILTGVTVAASELPVEMVSDRMAIAIGLAIALVKATLVAGVFMHLFAEKKSIYHTLILTVVFFFVLMMVPVVTEVEHHAIERLEPFPEAVGEEEGH